MERMRESWAMAEADCQYSEAGLRFDDMRKVEICASAGPSPDELAAIRDKIRAGFATRPDAQR